MQMHLRTAGGSAGVDRREGRFNSYFKIFEVQNIRVQNIRIHTFVSKTSSRIQKYSNRIEHLATFIRFVTWRKLAQPQLATGTKKSAERLRQ
jgi:hypothetical protein